MKHSLLPLNKSLPTIQIHRMIEKLSKQYKICYSNCMYRVYDFYGNKVFTAERCTTTHWNVKAIPELLPKE